MSRPGKSTADGQRWVYRFDGRRKCWFQTAEEAAVKKPVRHRVTKNRVADPEENEAARRKRKVVVDARAELLRSAPAESQPARPAPELKVVDAASVLPAAAAANVPPAPIENRAIDQPAPDRHTPRQVDVERLLTSAPLASNPVAASMPTAAPVAFAIAEAVDDGWGWMATWLGVVLMALGLIAVLGSSRTLREAMLLRD